jgi:hypothetical protein
VQHAPIISFFTFCFFFLITGQPWWTKASSLTRLRRHTQLGTPQSVGLLWTSDRSVAETSNNIHKILTSMPPTGFEPIITASERPQTRGHWDRPCFDYPNSICWGVRIMKLLSMQCPLVLCYLAPVMPIILRTLLSMTRSLWPVFLLQHERSSFTTTWNNSQMCVRVLYLYIYIYIYCIFG